MSAKKVQSSILKYFGKSPSVSSPSQSETPAASSPRVTRGQETPSRNRGRNRSPASAKKTPVSSKPSRTPTTLRAVPDSSDDEMTTSKTSASVTTPKRAPKSPLKARPVHDVSDDEVGKESPKKSISTSSARKKDPPQEIKRKQIAASSDDEEPPVIKRRKTRVKSVYNLYESSDEEDIKAASSDDSSEGDPEFKPDSEDEKEVEIEEQAETSTEMVDENEEPMEEDEISDDEVTPAKKNRAGKKSGGLSSFKSSQSRQVSQSARKPTSVNYKPPEDDSAFGESASAEWPPKDPIFDFLLPEKIRDKKRRRPDDEDYDPSTLYVPDSFMKSQTETQRQWWQIKSDHWDTVLLFKVGKFYELFQKDALTGIQELSLLPMGGSYYHSGFPEKSFNKFADILREKGYRVARVEQTESNEARDARLKKSGGPKCVNREVCRIITPGTSLLSTEINLSAPRLLYSIHQKVIDNNHFIFGVAFVDCTVSKFTISQFTDDRYCSRLRTLLAYHKPIEFIFEKKNLNPQARYVFDTWHKSVQTRYLVPEKQFLTPQATLELIKSRGYFDECKDGYPEAVKKLCDESDSNYLTPSEEFSEMARAFGGLLSYLKEILIDEELLSLGRVEFETPPDAAIRGEDAKEVSGRKLPSHMILDASTLAHLDIVDSELGVKYSLLGLLDHTSTRSGKRLFRSWVCSPLTDSEAINARLDAVDNLESFFVNHKSLFSALTSLPDLESLLTQIHKVGIKRKNHPDDRAQMFEDYDKAKVKCLLQSLDALKKISIFIQKLQSHREKFNSSLLKRITRSIDQGGMFPDLDEPIREFEQLFDVAEARKSSLIIPAGNWDPDLCAVDEEIKGVEKELANLLTQIKARLGCPVKYGSTKKERYLIEIDKKFASKVDTKKLTLAGSLKNSNRYVDRTAQKLAAQLKDLEEKKESLGHDTKRKLFAKFSQNIPSFFNALTCISTLDCLLSLVQAKIRLSHSQHHVCRPKIIDDATVPYIDIENGKHPILMQINDTFIPNSLKLCGDKMAILTGPNMGGKSTLMRQTALLAIMAQIGSYVPAAKFELTPIDRVFTRIGAYDNIASGVSTFKVEMDEASAIVKNATVDSLILMDELGRGTSTHDGTAIAHAVVQYLSKRLKCRTLFSTHYHDLIEGIDHSLEIQPLHMRCLEQVDPTTGHEEIIFMYKVTPGECPKSHGFNAARLAGLKNDMITLAKQKAQEMSDEAKITHQVRQVMKLIREKDTKELRSLIEKLCITA